jgi:hypothetical protein
MYKVKAKVWLYPGMAGWQFATIPKKESKIINQTYGALKKGWGSLPVNVTIGKTKWKTSIFPDKKTSSYLLPLKAEVRKKENIKLGNTLVIILEIIT